jgi:hypothetical protein
MNYTVNVYRRLDDGRPYVAEKQHERGLWQWRSF